MTDEWHFGQWSEVNKKYINKESIAVYIYMDWRHNNWRTIPCNPKYYCQTRKSRNKTLFTLLMSSWLTRPACVMYNWCMVSELVTQWQNVWLPSPSLASSHLHHRGWVSLDLFPSFPAGQMCRWSLREVIKSHRLTLHKTLALNHWKALVDVK